MLSGIWYYLGFQNCVSVLTRLSRAAGSFLQHVRDYHPRDILEREEYMTLRRQCCVQLNMPYREEPAFELPEPNKVTVRCVREGWN